MYLSFDVSLTMCGLVLVIVIPLPIADYGAVSLFRSVPHSSGFRFHLSQPRSITSFDVAPNGKLYAAGHADGSISVCPTLLEHPSASVVDQEIPPPASPTSLSHRSSVGHPNTEYTSRPHLSMVLAVRFFPSSAVVLTSSLDHTLRIHDALSPTLTTVRTFTGHTAAVTGVAVVDRGRNVLSASKDSTIRLWDVGGSKELTLRRWSTGAGAVAALCLDAGEGWTGYESSCRGEGNSQIPAANGEVGTENKLVFVGLQDGRVEGYDLRSKRSAFSLSLKQSGQLSSSSAAIDSIAFAPDSSMLATGARSGIVRWWDMRSCGRGEGPPLCEFRRNGAGIESIAWVPAGWSSSPQSIATPEEAGLEERERKLRAEDEVPVTLGGESLARGLPHLVVGTEDGLPWRAGLTPDARVVVVEEYVGSECGDGVREVRWCAGNEQGFGRGIWCAGDDGLVRVY